MDKSWIEKYKREDGYYDEDDCYYEDAESILTVHVLKFCGCGLPGEAMEFVGKVMRLLRDMHDDHDVWDAKWKELDELFPNDGIRYLVYYYLDNLELTEHGGSVPGWLTEKGKQVLFDIEQTLNEQDDPTPEDKEKEKQPK